MKIIVACENTNVSEHFGHCNQYLVADIEDNKISNYEYVPAPEHVPGKLPLFIAGLNADVVITGGIGQKAVDIFKANNIKVVVGKAKGGLEAIKKYLNDELVTSDEYCSGHDH